MRPPIKMHRLYLIPTDHDKVVAPKNENTLALTFTSLCRGQFGVAPNTRNTGLEGSQSEMSWWVGSREGTTRKQERETCGSTQKASFWEWLWESGVGWLQVFSLEGKKNWVAITSYLLLDFTTK